MGSSTLGKEYGTTGAPSPGAVEVRVSGVGVWAKSRTDRLQVLPRAGPGPALISEPEATSLA